MRNKANRLEELFVHLVNEDHTETEKERGNDSVVLVALKTIWIKEGTCFGCIWVTNFNSSHYHDVALFCYFR